jgi:predicted AAA+ superfamily ATPase
MIQHQFSIAPFLNTYFIFIAVHQFAPLSLVTDDRNITGAYIIMGSQDFLMKEQITQSLAGRVALFTLLPLSNKEL